MPRFWQGYPWRFVVTAESGQIITSLDGRASNRALALVLNKPAPFTCEVPSQDPEISLPWADGLPSVGTNRLIYGLRREDPDPGVLPPWVVRYGGLCLIAQDVQDAAGDQPMTALSAFDSWQYLYSVPVFNDDGTLLGPDGRTFTPHEFPFVSDVLVAILTTAEAVMGKNLYLDYGQTAFYTGVLDSVPNPSLVAARGSSVGDMLDQVSGATAPYVDIKMDPIYDPINRPGLVSQMSTYEQVGTTRYEAVMAWDMPSHSLSGIDHLEDMSQAANVVQFYNGTDGLPVARQTDAAAIALAGGHQWWYQQFFTQPSQSAVVETLAAAELAARAHGRIVLTISPAPGFSPIPELDYSLGDGLPIWASDRLRSPLTGTPAVDPRTGQSGIMRVYTIPLKIDDDDQETVEQMLMTAELT